MKRRLTGAVLIALLAVLVGALPASAFNHSSNEAAMLRLINQTRKSHGLATVGRAGPLDRAALAHSRDMIACDYFAHSSLGGASVAARARGAGYSTSGCSSWAVGEVIALGSSHKGTPRSIFTGWMRSSAHRQIILSSRWRDVGVGCVRGSYKGCSGVVMYTVDFGRRVK